MSMAILSWRRLRAVLFGTAAALLLAACGGGGDDDAGGGSGFLRLINATADLSATDLTVDGETGDESPAFSGVARDAQSDYISLKRGGYTLRAKRNGVTAVLALGGVSIEKDKRYSAVIFGREGDYRLTAVLEEENEPAAGRAALRVFNSAPDAGPVDVYLTESGVSLDDTVPTVRGVSPATLSFYNLVDRGTRRLRITAQGDPRDVRLDIAALELADKARVTLFLQPGPGGVLVHSLVSQHQGTLQALKNTHARVRLAAGVQGSGAVTANVGNASINVNLRSPSIGNYVLVPAGLSPVVVSINGQALQSRNTSFSAGGDYTLAVFGPANDADWRRVPDNNMLPVNAERAKLRLFHMASTLANEGVTLALDFTAVAQDGFMANPHLYSPVPSAASVRMEATTPTATTPLYMNDRATIAARGVYTTFVMDGQAQAAGFLRRER
jgi:hypothetical protein